MLDHPIPQRARHPNEELDDADDRHVGLDRHRPRTLTRHDHVGGVEVAVAEPVRRPQAIEQGEDTR